MKRLRVINCVGCAAIFLLVLSSVGCAPKNYKWSVFPKEEGVQIITTSASETDALEGAKREAEEYCEKEGGGKYVVIGGPETSYQGPERGGAAGIVKGVADALVGRNRDQDYRATITIKCK